MPTAHRVFRRFVDQQAAGKVASRFLQAMSYDEAKRTLGFPPSKSPTEDEVTRKYRERIIETMRASPEANKNQLEFKDLNIAKDTLLGKFDRQPRRPNDDPSTTGPYKRPQAPPRQEYQPPPPEEPPPVPEGVNFAAALSGLGHVDWKILTTGYWGYDVIVESEEPRKVYFAVKADFILVGRTASHYVFAKMTRKVNSRRNSDSGGKDVVARWDAFKVERPVVSTDLLKLAPKAIAALRDKARGRAKYGVLEGPVTEDKLLKFRGTLSLADAIAGSGILAEGADTSSLKGRKVQVEIEPVYSREKMDAWKASPGYNRVDTHLGYDWLLYINGKKHEIKPPELERLKKNYFLFALYSYDYDGKKNLTRLKGGRLFKMSAKEALEKLAQALDPGPVRDAVEAAAARASKVKP